MARTKEQKKEVMDKLVKIMAGANSLVFVNIHGLPVFDVTAMRKKLKADKVGLFVAKKSLARLALDAGKYQGAVPDMPGELALAYGEDLIAPARGVYEFQGKLKDKIAIVGGVFDGRYMDREGMTAIAAIPSPQVLRGMFVNVINSPIQGLVVALNQLAEKNRPA